MPLTIAYTDQQHTFPTSNECMMDSWPAGHSHQANAPHLCLTGPPHVERQPSIPSTRMSRVRLLIPPGRKPSLTPSKSDVAAAGRLTSLGAPTLQRPCAGASFPAAGSVLVLSCCLGGGDGWMDAGIRRSCICLASNYTLLGLK